MKKIIYKGMMDGLEIDRSVREQKYDMIKHWHPECEVQYYVEGHRSFFADEDTFHAQGGSLIMIKPHSVHHTYSSKKRYHDRILLLIEADKFKEASLFLGQDLNTFFEQYHGMTQIPSEQQAAVHLLLKNIADEVIEKKQGYQQLISVKLIELCLLMQRIQDRHQTHTHIKTSGTISDVRIDQIKQYIRDHLAAKPSVHQIAEMFYVDKSYLCRIFKKVTGYTITEYSNIYRVKEAQRLLEDTDLSLAHIAGLTGFNHITYFNRVFNKYTETSPLQYRKKKISYKESLREKNNL